MAVLIGELAARTGLTTKTVRYYEAIGLLEAPQRTEAGYRVYRDESLGRLSFIRAGQAIGLTLGELREIVGFRDRGETPCSHVVTLLDRKVAEIGRRIAELQELQKTLRGLQERAAHLSPEECPPTLVCHVILPKMPTEQATQAKAEPARRRV